ncbi:MAG TPA: DUF2934 domain-containing protein [Polyangia bacterium]
MKTTGRKTVKGDKVSAPKAVKAAPSRAAATATPMPTPTHDQIAKRSYELYLERGSVDGYASEDWIRAEAELKS